MSSPGWLGIKKHPTFPGFVFPTVLFPFSLFEGFLLTILNPTGELNDFDIFGA